MKKFSFQVLGLIILIFGGTYLTFNAKYLTPLAGVFKQPATVQQNASDKTDKLAIIGVDGVTKAQLTIEIADTKEVRSKGLGYRESLATDSGMLFIHDNSQKYTYWMKGMEFAIDIMWIKGDTIMDIIPNVPPPIVGQTEDTLERYSSTVDVDTVLETNAGFVAEKNIEKGDKIKIENAN